MPRVSNLPTISSTNFYATETIASANVGQEAASQDGRIFRYAQAGAVALVAGNVQQSPARDTQFTGLAVPAAIAIGETTLPLTNGTTTTVANEFAGGLAVVAESTGIGQIFTITGNTVATSGAALSVTIQEPVAVALSATSKVTIQKNQFSKVIVSPTTRTGKTAGVACVAAAISAYTWIQTHGHGAALSDATVAALGEGLSPSTTTAGTTTKKVTLLELIGTATLLQVSAKVSPVWLEID